jgi:hypothetical protein
VMVSLQASDDHHVPKGDLTFYADLDSYDWKHLIFTSAFYGAVGIWPSRDNIQTGADPNAEEDLLLATLMGGSIQLGHRIGQCDFDLVSRTYREGDGLLLKPDRPIAPLDRSYITGAALGYTQSTIGNHSWYYVLSLPPGGYFPVFTPSDLGISEASISYNYDTGLASIVQPQSPIYLDAVAKHQYFVLAPFVDGIAVLGDTSKFITMADMRVASVEQEPGKAVVVGVIANQARSPVIAGFDIRHPAEVTSENRKLPEKTSLKALEATPEGWYWDEKTKLWYVKVDFSGETAMQTERFTIR